MPMPLPEATRRRLTPGQALPPLPVPSRIVFNGEFTPPRQAAPLRRYEALMLDRARDLGPARLRGRSAMASAFGALNTAFGQPHFAVGRAETLDEDAAEEARPALANYRARGGGPSNLVYGYADPN